jgi:gamma-glutamyl:cysteine ligase YbdK (ATP-grasp superfamily)
LGSNVRQFLENEGQFTPNSSLQQEWMQSQIEAGSSVSSNVHEMCSENIRMRRLFRKLATEHGMAISTATLAFLQTGARRLPFTSFYNFKSYYKNFLKRPGEYHKNGRADLRLTG